MANKLTVPQAGTRLRRSFNQVTRLVMLGELAGGQDEQGHWWVDEADCARYASERAERASTSAPAA